MKRPGLYRNIAKKRARIKAQKAAGKTPERMRKPGSKGAPTAKAFKQSAKTAKKRKAQDCCSERNNKVVLVVIKSLQDHYNF